MIVTADVSYCVMLGTWQAVVAYDPMQACSVGKTQLVLNLVLFVYLIGFSLDEYAMYSCVDIVFSAAGPSKADNQLAIGAASFLSNLLVFAALPLLISVTQLAPLYFDLLNARCMMILLSQAQSPDTLSRLLQQTGPRRAQRALHLACWPARCICLCHLHARRADHSCWIYAVRQFAVADGRRPSTGVPKTSESLYIVADGESLSRMAG